MNPKNLSPFLALFFVLFFAIAIQGCTPSYCGVPEYVVTKFNDTNDGVCDGDCSLREAVINSNVCPGAQTIRIPAGTYDLSIAGTLEDAAATGDLDLTDDVTIIGEGAPFIDANGIDRVFEVFDTATVDLHTMLIRGGEEQVGAGIRNWGTLTMHGGVVANNTGVFPDGIMGGSSGGGIFSKGTLVLLGTQVRENSADMGGGIMIDDPGTFEMSTGSAMINGNIAHQTGGGLAVAFGAEATLTGVDIWRNEAGFDGGGIFNAGLITMNASAVYENIAGLEGGGLHTVFGGHTVGWEIRFEDNEAEQGGAILTSGLINLYQSSLNDNRATAGAGGAAFVDGAFPGLQLRNVTVSGNTATLVGSAGGLYNHGGDMLLEFITVAENDPLGLVVDAGGNLVMKSSILANNAAGNCSGVGPTGSAGYNVDDGTSCGFTSALDMSSTNPVLGPLAYNGGLTPTHALLPGSPAIDSGTPDMCTSQDQRGVSRPQGAQCDRGAYEFEFAILVATPILVTPIPIIPVTPTASPMPPQEVNARFIKNGFCRFGPRVDYRDITALEEGVEVLVEGRSAPGIPAWWWILLHSGGNCWVSDAVVEVTGPAEELPVIEAPPPPPEAPVGLDITERVCDAKLYRLNLSWSDVSNETGYRVYRDGASLATLGANATSYQDKPPFGGPYTYAVEAYNNSGTSSRVTVTDPGCNPPK